LAPFVSLVPAWAASEFDAAFTGYVLRMALAVIVLGGVGYAAVKLLPGMFSARGRGHVRVLGMQNIGREMIYIVKTGPEVTAFVSGRAGSTVLGRWSLEEWDDYEAAADAREARPAE